MTCRNGSHYECEKCKEPCLDKGERIYTVTSTYIQMEGLERLVVGSYRLLDNAVDECVDYIMGRLNTRSDIAYAFANDVNHAEAASWMAETDDGYAVTDPIALRQYIRDELDGSMCYYVFDGEDKFHFDIDENDLVG